MSPNVRSKDKKQVKVWLTEPEHQELIRLTDFHGFGNLTDFLRWIAVNGPAPAEPIRRVAEPATPPPILFPARILGSVAAGGTSEDYDDEEAQLDHELPKGHYLLRVNGHSMEPDIPDGSLIEVKPFKGLHPRKGEIVVYADGTGTSLKMYMSRKDEDGNRVGELHSINPEYPGVEPVEDGEIQAVMVQVLPDQEV